MPLLTQRGHDGGNGRYRNTDLFCQGRLPPGFDQHEYRLKVFLDFQGMLVEHMSSLLFHSFLYRYLTDLSRSVVWTLPGFGTIRLSVFRMFGTIGPFGELPGGFHSPSPSECFVAGVHNRGSARWNATEAEVMPSPPIH